MAAGSTADRTESLTAHVAPYEAGAPVAAATFLGSTPALARDDGHVVLGAPAMARVVRAHPDGAILATASTGSMVVSGGDDGLIVGTGADGSTRTLHDAGGRWIDALAARPDGAIAWGVGKSVSTRDAKGVVRSVDVPTTARGLAFAPKGYRLAIAHYNGASLWFPNAVDAPPDAYAWKGSHVSVTFSPDGRFAVTAMQENALHGWRLSDHANMRMSGYPSRVRSLAWSGDGLWLATSGADACVIWPFRDKDGPMNKAPRECAVREAKVSRVAFNPKTLLLAVGYEDGWVLLCRLSDGVELLVRRTEGERHAVTALAWSGDGTRLLFGTEGGQAGLLTLPGR